MYQPKIGARCFCKRGVQRDNCPACEGTGWRIDFRAIRERALTSVNDQDEGDYRNYQDNGGDS